MKLVSPTRFPFYHSSYLVILTRDESSSQELAWRNWIARWTSNPAVVGSSPTVS